jgi:hypothetical protein
MDLPPLPPKLDIPSTAPQGMRPRSPMPPPAQFVTGTYTSTQSYNARPTQIPPVSYPFPTPLDEQQPQSPHSVVSIESPLLQDHQQAGNIYQGSHRNSNISSASTRIINGNNETFSKEQDTTHSDVILPGSFYAGNFQVMYNSAHL